MEAEELYLKLIDKNALVQMIKNARLKKRTIRNRRSNVIVPGYEMNPEKAPINLLISSIKKNIDVSEIIRDNYSKKAEELKYLSIDEFILKANREGRDWDTKTTIEYFCVFLINYPDEEEKYLPLIQENLEKNQFIFDIDLIIRDNTEASLMALLDIGNIKGIQDEYSIDILKEKILKLELISNKDFKELKNMISELDFMCYMDKFETLRKKYNPAIINMIYITTHIDQGDNLTENDKLAYNAWQYKVLYEFSILTLSKVYSEYFKYEEECNMLKVENDKLYKTIQKNKEVISTQRLEVNKLKSEIKGADNKIKEMNDEKSYLKASIDVLKKDLEKYSMDDSMQNENYVRYSEQIEKLIIYSNVFYEIYNIFFPSHFYVNADDVSINEFEEVIKTNSNYKIVCIDSTFISTQNLLKMEELLEQHNINYIEFFSYNHIQAVSEILRRLGKGRM